MKPDSQDNMWKFEFYIAGNDRRSALAVENLREFCKNYLHGNCRIDLINLKEHPEKMAENRIFATPTLIRKYPGPEKVLVGDLSNTVKVLKGLGIRDSPGRSGPLTYRDGLNRQGLSSKWNHVRH